MKSETLFILFDCFTAAMATIQYQDDIDDDEMVKMVTRVENGFER